MSFFHAAKKKLFSGTRTVDTEYQESAARFLKMGDNLDKLKGHFDKYIIELTNISTVGLKIGETYKTINNGNDNDGEDGKNNEHDEIKTTFKDFHNELKDVHIVKIQDELKTKIMIKIDEINKYINGIRESIKKRESVRSEYDYYNSKIQKLRDAKTKRSSKQLPEKPKDIERLKRNEEKLEELRNKYEAQNKETIRVLNEAYSTRYDFLQPLIESFINIEKEFIKCVARSLKDVEIPDISIDDKSDIKEIETYDDAKTTNNNNNNNYGNNNNKNVRIVKGTAGKNQPGPPPRRNM